MVNYPEIALTLEKFLIKVKIIVCSTGIEFFLLSSFLDMCKLSHVASTNKTKVTKVSLWTET